MKIIQSQYRGYYKDEQEVRFALSVMGNLFADWEYQLIEKATYRFLTTDAKGFPPVPGQLITLAAEIRRMEWEEKQRKTQSLPEPDVKGVGMPEEIREKIKDLFSMPFKD